LPNQIRCFSRSHALRGNAPGTLRVPRVQTIQAFIPCPEISSVSFLQATERPKNRSNAERWNEGEDSDLKKFWPWDFFWTGLAGALLPAWIGACGLPNQVRCFSRSHALRGNASGTLRVPHVQTIQPFIPCPEISSVSFLQATERPKNRSNAERWNEGEDSGLKKFGAGFFFGWAWGGRFCRMDLRVWMAKSSPAVFSLLWVTWF